MRLELCVLLSCFLISIGCFADSIVNPTPTLGFYIPGETGNYVLDTIIPELARLKLSEATPRDMSIEHFPVSNFRHARCLGVSQNAPTSEK